MSDRVASSMPQELLMLRPDRLPAAVRFIAYGFAVAVLLYLTLAPGDYLPSTNIWDKAQHFIAWFVLTALGLAFWPNRPGRIGAFVLSVGGLVEVLQSILPFGRDGDIRDLFGDSVGIVAALLIWVLLRRLASIASGQPGRADGARSSPTGLRHSHISKYAPNEAAVGQDAPPLGERPRSG